MTGSKTGRCATGLKPRLYLLAMAALTALPAWLTHRYGPAASPLVWLLGMASGLTAVASAVLPEKWVQIILAMDLTTQDMTDR